MTNNGKLKKSEKDMKRKKKTLEEEKNINFSRLCHVTLCMCRISVIVNHNRSVCVCLLHGPFRSEVNINNYDFVIISYSAAASRLLSLSCASQRF